MKPEEYVKSFIIDGREIKLGIDDYGQCYFIEWVDEDGNTQEMGLGTYNFNYMEDIYYMFDKRYKELRRADFTRELSKKEIKELEKYYDMFNKECDGT